MYNSFCMIVFFREFFLYFSLHIHVYIRASDPLINTSIIHNSSIIAVIVTGGAICLGYNFTGQESGSFNGSSSALLSQNSPGFSRLWHLVSTADVSTAVGPKVVVQGILPKL
jgi:hypothetical protein